MEFTSASEVESGEGLDAVFSDLVRLETELWDRVDHRLRHDHDVPLSWFEPMQVMDRVPGCRVADIAQALSITVGGSSKLVDRIEKAGWCERRPNPDDARSSLVRLTRAGRRRFDVARRTFEEELEGSLGAVLSPVERASLAMAIGIARRRLSELPTSAR